MAHSTLRRLSRSGVVDAALGGMLTGSGIEVAILGPGQFARLGDILHRRPVIASESEAIQGLVPGKDLDCFADTLAMTGQAIGHRHRI